MAASHQHASVTRRFSDPGRGASTGGAAAQRERLSVDVTWRSLFRIVAALVLVWLWLTLAQLVLLVLVALILSISLDPLVQRIEGKGVARGPAAAMVSFALVIVLAGFGVLAWTSLSGQAQTVGQHLVQTEQRVATSLPGPFQKAFATNGSSADAAIASYTGAFLRSLVSAVIVVVLAFILMLYLLIEGERTYAWLVAFVPKARRPKVDRTADEVRRVIFAYAVGNITTSIFATVVVLIALTVLKVPAAFLLAVLAGICDFVPVIGFIVSAIPALVLALTVSTTTAIIVAAVYIAYHVCENYYVAPRIYGNQLRLSNVVVVLAFAAGAAIAGVVGALIALPVAAVYPAIEQIWLREQLGGEVVRDHREIENAEE